MPYAGTTNWSSGRAVRAPPRARILRTCAIYNIYSYHCEATERKGTYREGRGWHDGAWGRRLPEDYLLRMQRIHCCYVCAATLHSGTILRTHIINIIRSTSVRLLLILRRSTRTAGMYVVLNYFSRVSPFDNPELVRMNLNCSIG